MPAEPAVPIAAIATMLADLPAQEQVPVPEQLPAPAPPPLPQEPEDVVVTGRDDRGDPLASVNAQVVKAAEGADKAVIGPAARAYERHVPGPLRSGLRNFLFNLREPIVFFNYLLQLKPGKAAETAGRFALNSTVGVLGVMDVAKRRPFRLRPRRNSFANTLGLYGIGPGPFFFLPLVGPTTLRDLVGTVVDQTVLPGLPIRVSSSPTYTVPIGVLSALDYRARIEPDLQRQRATSDHYAALRRDYFARRQAEIDGLRGPSLHEQRAPKPARVY